jgi:signal transduction histidine kinase
MALDLKRAYELEKKAKEDLEALDKTKNEFMLVTQHHLRTPLTSMMGYVDLIDNGAFGKVPKKLEPVVAKFGASARDLIKIVNEFLDASQFQLGKKVITVKPGVNVEVMLDSIVKELTVQANAKKIFLTFNKPQNIPLIEADASKLQVAFTNIIDNSVKYTLEGGVAVVLEVTDHSIQVSVKDTGIGIDQDALQTIFDNLFVRRDEAKKANAVGSGIGLYLSAKIIVAHGGKIWVESEGKGKGSTFFMRLPISQPRQTPAAAPVS